MQNTNKSKGTTVNKENSGTVGVEARFTAFGLAVWSVVDVGVGFA